MGDTPDVRRGRLHGRCGSPTGRPAPTPTVPAANWGGNGWTFWQYTSERDGGRHQRPRRPRPLPLRRLRARSSSRYGPVRARIAARRPDRIAYDCWPHGRQRHGHARRRRPARDPRPARTRSSTSSARRSSATTRRSPGPFGVRRVTYADYTASGRSLDVHRGLHPRRGPAAVREHPHRVVGHRASRRRASARRRGGSSATACGGDAERPRRDLLRLGLDRRDQPARRRPQPAHPGRPRRPLRTCARRSRASERPVVFIGPYEHHSNELPWRESIADVVDDPRGPRRAHRPRRSSSAELGALRGPAAEDRRRSRPRRT